MTARWQHDAHAPVKELQDYIPPRLGESSSPETNARADLICRVDSRAGGWCEAWEGDRRLFRHPEPPQRDWMADLADATETEGEGRAAEARGEMER